VAGKKVNLVVGGGINPNHKNDKLVRAYVKEVREEAKKRGVVVTGFVPAEEMVNYLSGCDMMIFPYRAFLSSSGPLALAWSYGKLAVLSQALAAYGESEDVKENLKKNGLRVEDLVFDWGREGVVEALERVVAKRARVKNFDRAMLVSRSLEVVAQKTWKVIDGV
jgi:glycosyltransferase involved in cell wall biosynthesis